MTIRQDNTAMYETWANMKTRCFNPNAPGWARYGGRGITVCARWSKGEDGRTGFECFLHDMGPRPDGLTLERDDNDGDYAPENCRWATRKEQARNRRSSIEATVDGVTLCAQDWAAKLGVSRNAFYTRARRDGCETAVRHYQKHGLGARKEK